MKLIKTAVFFSAALTCSLSAQAKDHSYTPTEKITNNCLNGLVYKYGDGPVNALHVFSETKVSLGKGKSKHFGAMVDMYPSTRSNPKATGLYVLVKRSDTDTIETQFVTLSDKAIKALKANPKDPINLSFNTNTQPKFPISVSVGVTQKGFYVGYPNDEEGTGTLEFTLGSPDPVNDDESKKFLALIAEKKILTICGNLKTKIAECKVNKVDCSPEDRKILKEPSIILFDLKVCAMSSDSESFKKSGDLAIKACQDLFPGSDIQSAPGAAPPAAAPTGGGGKIQ